MTQRKNNLKAFCFIVSLALSSFVCKAQDRIFAIGYTKNFVNKDSSNISFTIDINRLPGKSEASGTYFLVNTPAFEQVNIFIKPTADVNLGSFTTLAANNVGIGLPIGLSRKLGKNNPNSKWGSIWGSIEVGPDFIADKSFDNYLYYVSPGVSLNYSYSSLEQTIVDLGVGIKYGYGERLVSVETNQKSSYEKFIVPIGLAINALRSKDDSYHHLKLSGIYKFNKILKDDLTISPGKDKNYLQVKLDYYFTGEFGFNITYTSGYEEPLFKKVNSLALGITFARKG